MKNIQDKLTDKDENGDYKIREVHLLIGNTCSMRTIEELARIHREPERIAKQIDRQKRRNILTAGKETVILGTLLTTYAILWPILIRLMKMKH